MAQSEQRRGIPTSLSIEEFDEFVCPFLTEGRRGPKSKVTLHAVIFNRGLIPNIPENRRGRKKAKRGRKRCFEPEIFRERFCTIERVFAWEDKFRRLLLRFERISAVHYALKTLAYTMINLWHFCRA